MAKTQQVKQPTTKQPKEQPKDEALTTVLKAFDEAWEYTSSSWHDRWQNNYKLYNNERVKRGYLGISDTFVPMVFGTVETLTSALFGTKPKFGYLPSKDNPDQNMDILNALADFFWDKDQWSMKVINTGRGMLREGTSVDYMCWDVDHPRLLNIAIRDFFIDPNAFELDERSTRYCGRRFLITLDELKEFEVIDLDGTPDEQGNPPMKPKYKNLSQLEKDSTEASNLPNAKTGVNQEQTTDKQEKDMFYGSTMNDPQANQIEVIEYWTVDKTISIANRKVVIEDSENYFKAKARANGDTYPRGILPFAGCRDYVDGSLFYAKGEVDFIADQQEDLNDFSNQMKDAVSFNLNQMKTLDPKYAHLMKEIQNIPGEIIPVPKDALWPVPMGQIPTEAFNERQNIKAEIRETTASNEVVKGAAQSGAKTTATEINAQVAGAGQRINLKVTQIENEYFHRLAKILYHMIKLYVTEPMMVRILGKDGAQWETFDPEEFQHEYEPQVQLDISIENKKQQAAADSANLLKAFMGNPIINQEELAKLVLQRGFDLDPDEVQLLITPQQPMGMPGLPGAPVDPNAPPMPPMPGQPPMDGSAPPLPPEQALPDHATPTLDGGDPASQDAPPIDPALLAQLLGAG